MSEIKVTIHNKDVRPMRIRALIEQLHEWSYAYYVEDAPMVSDAVYDGVFDELANLEKETGIVYPDSPTQKVQGEVVDYLPKVKHSKPMLSCAKTKSVEEVLVFQKKNLHGCMASLKLDGLTVVISYKNGILFRAVTRGNGVEGEDVTHNARMIRNLPQTIKFKGDLELRGECIIKITDFEEINIDGQFANPRNAAAGGLRQLDSAVAYSRQLSFIAFDLITEFKFDTKSQEMEWLEELGFEVVPNVKLVGDYTVEEIENILYDLKETANVERFPIDGVVIEYEWRKFAKSLGATAHHENRQLAFKFTDEVVQTKFRGVELNVGRNSIVSLTGIFDPVEIDGTIVSRASLHNVDIFRALELGIGDTITVYKANQIIPQIQDNLTRSRTYDLPTFCPCCGEELKFTKDVNTTVLVCENPNCSAKSLAKLVLFCSKDGMDINGLGEAQLEQLVNKGWVKNAYDLYELSAHRWDWENMEGWGLRSVDNILVEINGSRIKNDLAHFITALGIPNIGKSSAKLIAEKCDWDFNKFYRLLKSDCENLITIDGFGYKTIDDIQEWWSNEDNQKLLGNFLRDFSMGSFTFNRPEAPKQDSIFTGKTFCITGTFDMGPRPGIIAQIESLGGKSVTSVSKKTDYLLAGRDCGSKLQKARENGVRIIEEEELRGVLNEL